MKKTIYSLICALTCTALMSSCLMDDNGSESNPPAATGTLLYNSVINQSTLALDPFNIAFRLNTLLVEGEGDIDNAPIEIKEKLFGRDTEIKCKYEFGEYNYTIRYYGSSGSKDQPRSGTVAIKTITKYLTDPQATWIVLLPKENPYSLKSDYSPDYGSSFVEISAGAYLVINAGTNTWRAEMMSFQSANKISSPSGDMIGNRSNWTASYTIKQLSEGQSYEKISNTTFSVDIDVRGAASMYLSNNLIVKTPDSPLLFSTKCPYNKINGGKMNISLSSDAENITSCEWVENKENECRPKIRITLDGETTDYDL